MIEGEGQMRARVRRLAVLAAVSVWVLLVSPFGTSARQTAITDTEFWRMVTTFSEAGGSFPSNNFVSNELAFQTVVPRLKASIAPGGVYLGVGPDQNFTYLSSLKPKLAFIVDIRRQNMLQHLLYKAIIERSPGRVEFLSRLFSRPRPPEMGDEANIETIINAFAAELPSEDLFERNVREVREQLADKHKFPLSDADWQTIRFVYRAFFEVGPDLTYEGGQVRVTFRDPATDARVLMPLLNTGVFPSYGELMMQSDGQGTNQAYLATQERYDALRDLQLNNLIVPIVGDFAGDKAIRAIAAYLKQGPAPSVVTAFYTSNVEQYLFQNGVWRAYYNNVAQLPLDPTSMFIRSYFPSQTIRIPFTLDHAVMPQRPGVIASVTLLCPIKELLAAVDRNDVKIYLDVIGMSK
jgi:hypothetical protein